jgi:hypothetical protein
MDKHATDREDAWLVFKILTESTPAMDFLLKSCNFGVGRHCTSQRLTISAGVIVTIVGWWLRISYISYLKVACLSIIFFNIL